MWFVTVCMWVSWEGLTGWHRACSCASIRKNLDRVLVRICIISDKQAEAPRCVERGHAGASGSEFLKSGQYVKEFIKFCFLDPTSSGLWSTIWCRFWRVKCCCGEKHHAQFPGVICFEYGVVQRTMWSTRKMVDEGVTGIFSETCERVNNVMWWHVPKHTFQRSCNQECCRPVSVGDKGGGAQLRSGLADNTLLHSIQHQKTRISFTILQQFHHENG